MKIINELSIKQLELKQKLKDIESTINFEYDTRGFTTNQRKAFAELITPIVFVGIKIKECIKVLEGK